MVEPFATHPLHLPVTVDGIEYTEMKVRRLKGRDVLLSIKRKNITPYEDDLKQLTNLCQVPPAVIEELDSADIMALQAILRSFAKPAEEDVRKAIMILSISVGWDLATLENMDIDDIIAWLRTLKEVNPANRQFA